MYLFEKKNARQAVTANLPGGRRQDGMVTGRDGSDGEKEQMEFVECLSVSADAPQLLVCPAPPLGPGPFNAHEKPVLLCAAVVECKSMFELQPSPC